MRLEISTNTHTICEFFENCKMFKIPGYQRSYAWKEEQVKSFLDDINYHYKIRKNSLGEESHFLGGIVSIEKKEEKGPTNSYEIVDGQQRITTIVIFIRTLLKKYNELISLNEFPNEMKDTVNLQINTLKKSFLQYETRVGTNIEQFKRLVPRDKDHDFFNNFIENGKFSDVESDISKKRLKENSEIIEQWISNLIENEEVRKKIEILYQLDDVIQKDLIIIHVIAKNKDMAYRLFRVLNDRGLNLSAGDLIKSELIESIEAEGDQKKIEKMWDIILKEESKFVDDILRWVYISYTGKRAGKDTLHTDILKDIFTEKNYTQIFNKTEEIMRCIKLYCSILDNNTNDIFDRPLTLWEKTRINILLTYLDSKTCIPLILSSSLLEADSFFEIMFSFEKFFFRYKTICNGSAEKIHKLCAEAAKEIRTIKNAYDYKNFKITLQSQLLSKANDDIFEQFLIEKLSYKSKGRTNKMIKYFLGLINYYIYSPNWSDEDFIAEVKNTNNILDLSLCTIEHVYPQNPIDKDEDLDEVVNRIGNLILLSPDDNLEVKNKIYKEKQELLKESSLFMNRDLFKEKEWTQEKVLEKEKKLIELAKKIFKFD